MQLKDTCEEWGLKRNMSKTEHLTTRQKRDVLLSDTNIKTVKEFNYCRSTIIEKIEKNQSDVERRIAECRKAIIMMNSFCGVVIFS